MFSLCLAGCSSNGPVADVTTPLSTQDASFATFAAQSSNSEIAAANVALKQSSNAQVTAFANRMITDHSNANSAEASVAQHIGVTPSTAPDPAEAAKLASYQNQTGVTFDQSYANDQVAAHQNTIAQFQTEIGSGSNAQLVAFAQQQLPILQSHLQAAQALVTAGQ